MAGSGGSSAFVVVCADGIGRIVKARGNPQGDRILVNELVVAQLAAMLGAPCPPDPAVIDIPEVVLDKARAENANLANASAGLGFGCHWFEVTYSPGVDLCRTASNRPALIRLAALYIWTRNSDFKAEHLLHRTLADGTGHVLGFDHGHCFGSPGWDATIEQQASVAYNLAGASVDQAIDGDDLDACIADLMALTSEQIQCATQGVPPEWGVSPDELGALGAYLVASRQTVVDQLMDRYKQNPGGQP